MTYASSYKTIVSNGGVSGYGKHLAIGVFGDFRYVPPTMASRLSLRAFCACAIEDGRLTQTYSVLGHVEDKPFSAYECPGQAMLDVLHKWPNIFD